MRIEVEICPSRSRVRKPGQMPISFAFLPNPSLRQIWGLGRAWQRMRANAETWCVLRNLSSICQKSVSNRSSTFIPSARRSETGEKYPLEERPALTRGEAEGSSDWLCLSSVDPESHLRKSSFIFMITEGPLVTPWNSPTMSTDDINWP